MFAALYHIQHNKYTEDLPFWLDLASNSKGLTLELGCGTGRVLIPLAEAGNPVIGLDNDFAMLQFAASQIPASLAGRISLLQADMASFHLSAEFGAIFLPCNTLSSLQTPVLHSMLSCVWRHLGSAGIFAASLPNPQLLANMPAFGDEEIEENFPHPQAGEPVQVSSSWQRTGQQFVVTWFYDHLLPNGQVERLQTIIHHQIQPAELYVQTFKSAGFELVRIYGDFHRRPYRRNSPHLILIAAKP